MRRYLALLLILLLIAPMTAESTGTLTIPTVFGALTAGRQNLALFDTTFNAIRDYINNREITFDLASNRPAAGTHGRYFFATDTSVFSGDTGAAWQQLASNPVYTAEITGLSTSRPTATQVLVAAGAASSDDATVSSRVLMTLASATQGNTAGTWVVGNFQNKLDAGTLGSNQSWHVYEIQRADTGNVDILFSQSATAPTMPTNYTKKRRISYFMTTGAAQIIVWTQHGDEFIYLSPGSNPLDVAEASPGTAALLATATCPNGVSTQAILHAEMDITSTTQQALYLSSTDAADEAPSTTTAPLASLIGGSTTALAGLVAGAQVRVWTSTARQFRFRLSSSGATTALRIQTIGCVYPRQN